MKIFILLITLATVSVYATFGQQPITFLNYVDLIPKSILNSENAVIINFIENSYGQNKKPPKWEEVSNNLSKDLGRLGIGVNIIIDSKAFDIPDLRAEFFDKANELENAHIFNIVVMCGNRNGKDFCTYMIMLGKYNGEEILHDQCEDIYKVHAFDYNKLIRIFEKKLIKQGLLRNTPKNNDPDVITLEALSNVQFHEYLPDDISRKSIVILRSEPIEIPSPLPKCASAMLAKQMKMGNAGVTTYNEEFSKLMSTYKGEYKFIPFKGIGLYYGKENVYQLNCMASTNSEIERRFYNKSGQQVIARGKGTRQRTKLHIIIKYYLYLKDMKTGERYFMNLGSGKDTWQDCVEEFVNITNK